MRRSLNRSAYLAWLVAPSLEQQCQVSKATGWMSYELAVYTFWYERSPFGDLELFLRRFWLQVARRLPRVS